MSDNFDDFNNNFDDFNNDFGDESKEIKEESATVDATYSDDAVRNATPAARQTGAEVCGKKPAIISFVFAMIAIDFLFACLMANSMYANMDIPSEAKSIAVTILRVFTLIPSIPSLILAIFAWKGVVKNKANGVSSKLVLIFTIIATAVSAVAFLYSVIMLAS